MLQDGLAALHISTTMSRLNHVQFLLDGGAAVNSTDKDMRTALFIALFLGCREIAELLILRGADVVTNRIVR